MRILLLTVLFVSSVFAKNTDFSLVISRDFDDALTGVAEDYGRTISAVGFVNTYKKPQSDRQKIYKNAFDYLSSISSSSSQQIHIVKVDNDAKIVFENTVLLPGVNKAVGIVKTPQDGYYVGGTSNDGSLLLLKLDSDANVLFRKKFELERESKMGKIASLYDGGVLCISSSSTSRSSGFDKFDSGLGLKDSLLSRFSENGELLWSKKHGTLYDDTGVDAVEAEDGSIIVLTQTSREALKYVTVSRVSADGESIWTKEFKDAKNMDPRKIIKLNDGAFLISMSQDDEVGKKQPRVIKIDIQGNTLKDKLIHTSYATELLDIKEFKDSNIVGAGYVRDRYDTDALVMLMDSELNMLAQEHYGEEGAERFNSLEILHNSQIAAVGIHASGSSQESDMWIVKLNKDLSIAQVSSSAAKLNTELAGIFQKEISDGSISIKENLHVAFIDEELLFNVGEYELNDAQKEFLDRFAAKFVPFMYKNREFIDGFEIGGHTSSEWGDAKFEQRYLNNQDLSMKRSFSTLSYIFSKQDEKTQKWLSSVLKSSGHGFAKRVLTDGSEEMQKSRRVSFKILLR